MFLDRNHSSSITLSLASFAIACSFLAAAPSVMAQAAKSSVKPADKPAEVPQGLRVLTGVDAKRAEELSKGIAAAEDADNRGEAIQMAEELLALHAVRSGTKALRSGSHSVVDQGSASSRRVAEGRSARRPGQPGAERTSKPTGGGG